MGYGNFAYKGGFDNGKYLRERLVRTYGKVKRSVFETDMVAHVWAQQNQPYGSNAKGSLYFEQGTIYSYGSHFPIARIIPGQAVALFTDRHYTPTTNGHVRKAETAVRHFRTFRVRDVFANTPESHQANLDSLVAAVHGLIALSRNTRRSPANRLSSLRMAKSAAGVANEYSKCFFPRRRKPAIDITSLDASDEVVNLKLAEGARQFKAFEKQSHMRDRYLRKSAIFAMVKTARKIRALGGDANLVDPRKILKRWHLVKASLARVPNMHATYVRSWHRYCETARATAQDMYSEQEPRLYPIGSYAPFGYGIFDRFCRSMRTTAEIAHDNAEAERRRREYEAERARTEGERIKSWRDGKNVGGLSHLPCMLRKNGQTVQTSWGADFPLNDALAAWPKLARILATGKEFQKGLGAIKLGLFQIDRVTSDGTIYAGCHTIMRDEVLRLADALNLDTSAVCV